MALQPGTNGNSAAAALPPQDPSRGHAMTYLTINFKTKKAAQDALREGMVLKVWQPGPFAAAVPQNGTAFIEGPWAPERQTWYGQATLQDGVVKRLR